MGAIASGHVTVSGGCANAGSDAAARLMNAKLKHCESRMTCSHLPLATCTNAAYWLSTIIVKRDGDERLSKMPADHDNARHHKKRVGKSAVRNCDEYFRSAQ
jgi:hypothetical protein